MLILSGYIEMLILFNNNSIYSLSLSNHTFLVSGDCVCWYVVFGTLVGVAACVYSDDWAFTSNELVSLSGWNKGTKTIAEKTNATQLPIQDRKFWTPYKYISAVLPKKVGSIFLFMYSMHSFIHTKLTISETYGIFSY